MALPGRELFRVGCTGIYLKPFGMRLLAAAASELVMRQFLSTCSVHACQHPETQSGLQKPLTPMVSRSYNQDWSKALVALQSIRCGMSIATRDATLYKEAQVTLTCSPELLRLRERVPGLLSSALSAASSMSDALASLFLALLPYPCHREFSSFHARHVERRNQCCS